MTGDAIVLVSARVALIEVQALLNFFLLSEGRAIFILKHLACKVQSCACSLKNRPDCIFRVPRGPAAPVAAGPRGRVKLLRLPV